MSILGQILGSKQVRDSSIEGIDKLFDTKEEQRERKIKFLEAFEPFKLAQRLLALMITAVYLFLVLLSGVLLFLSFWFNEFNQIAKDLAANTTDALGWSFMLIIAFYFSAGAVEGVINKWKEKQLKK